MRRVGNITFAYATRGENKVAFDAVGGVGWGGGRGGGGGLCQTVA